jgi:hypothetical protein
MTLSPPSSRSKPSLRADIAALQQQLTAKKRQLITQASQEQGFRWEPLGDRLGLLHDPRRRYGWQHTGYLGFATRRQAERCAAALARQGLASQLDIRKARRLLGCKWELKATNLDPGLLHHLAREKAQARAEAGGESGAEHQQVA